MSYQYYKQELDKFIAKHKANEFTPENAPDEIVLNNIIFKRWSGGDWNSQEKYRSTYQSTVSNSNGEYPGFDIVIKRVEVKGRFPQYKYSKKECQLW